MIEYTATSESKKHYKRPEVRRIIQRISRDGDISKAGNGDFSYWYRQDGDPRLVKLIDDKDYNYLFQHFRTIYWTLNYFTAETYNRARINDDDVLGTPGETMGYTLGIDIDKCEGCDIHDATVKKAIEDMAQFLCDELLKYQPKSVYAAFSGGGIYIYLHHKIWDADFKSFKKEEKEKELFILTKSFNLWISDKEQEFFKLHPEHIDKCKADKLNNSKRVFKSLLSIHRKYPYVVIPLNPHKIEINFEKATLPLSEDVLKSAETWYTDYDSNTGFAIALSQYTKRAITLQENRTYREKGKAIEILPEAVRDLKNFPPCIINIMSITEMPAGGHRAVAFLSAFLGQVGWEYNNAYALVNAIARKLKVGGSDHIFRSWFKKLLCPSCRKIQEEGSTYPDMAMGDLYICDFCENIKHPMQYVEDQLLENQVKKQSRVDNPSNNPGLSRILWVPPERTKNMLLPVPAKQRLK